MLTLSFSLTHTQTLRRTFGVPLTARPAPAPKAPPARLFALQPMPAGREAFHETNDCSVKALVWALGLPYAEAHGRLRAAGRVNRLGCTSKVMEAALGGPKWVSAGPWWQKDRLPTMAQWMATHRTGTHIVFYTGHFTVVRDGVQLDCGYSLYKPRARVLGHWTIAA